MRARTWLAAMVVVAAVGCSADSKTSTSASQTSTPTTAMDTSTSVATTSSTVPLGPPSGTVTEAGPGRYDIAYDHAALGPMTVSVFAAGDNGPASVTATDATGGVVYQYDANLYKLAPARLDDAEGNPGAWAATDATTNVFIEYNPGRSNGVMILIPTTTGFTAGATEWTDSSQGRFYSASLVDQESDGTFEISQISNDCDPSCGAGTSTATIFHWNGSDYVEGPASGAAGGAADQISVDALGPVSLGMTVSEIEGRGYLVGEPSACGDIRLITGGPGDISTHFDGDVLRDASTRDQAYVTLSGIRVGSSASEVRAAYGANAQDTTLMGGGGPFPAIVLRSPQASEAGRTLWFYLHNGAVDEIVLVPYDTDPFPGC